MASTFNRSKKPLAVTFVVIVIVLLITKITTSNSSAKNFQEVLLSIPNENILGISNFIFDQNEKKQEEFLKKIIKVNEALYETQDKRLQKLEEQNEMLLEEVRLLRAPPPSSLLREKLAFLFAYDPSGKFPASIWQSWKHGLNDERFDAKFKEGQSQWAYKNPDFVHELFNDDTSHMMIKHLYSKIPEVIEAYEAMPELILRMDFFRYLVLYAKGGVYADVDTFPLQPIPTWIPERIRVSELGLILSIETDSNSPNWRSKTIRRLQFGQFIIQAKPGHPILREIIARITEETLKRKAESNNGINKLELTGSSNQKNLEIMQWTGSGMWTDVIFNYFNDYLQSSVYQSVTWKDFHDLKTPKLVSDILVLPQSSFASELEVSKDGKITDPLAFAKHYSAKIWKSS